MSNIIRRLCETHTNLNAQDIEKVIDVSKSIQEISDISGCDAFIDVPCKKSDEAIVVAEGRSEKSIYEDSVVGKLALRGNEPCVLVTLETGEVFSCVRALTQENKFVRQKIHPIRNKDKIIGVIILEYDISDEIRADFKIKGDESENKMQKTQQIMNLINSNQLISDNLNVAILLYDEKGILQIKNRRANLIYTQCGYSLNFDGAHYDKLALDRTNLRSIDKILEVLQDNKKLTKEINVGNLYFKVKTILIKEDDLRVMEVIEDITDIKTKEAEIISKSVAIQEIHHRVKNNLQTVASLLRIQARRCSSNEAKVSLQDSVNRILAIAATHELLSKDIGDEVEIMKVINAIVDNSRRCFSNNQKNIEIEVSGDDFYANTDRITAIALIVNELIQNCYDHAFKNRDTGFIKVNILERNKFVEISIADNGVGFEISENKSSSIGMSIVKSYVSDKLRGFMDINTGEYGTEVKITFPVEIK